MRAILEFVPCPLLELAKGPFYLTYTESLL